MLHAEFFIFGFAELSMASSSGFFGVLHVKRGALPNTCDWFLGSQGRPRFGLPMSRSDCLASPSASVDSLRFALSGCSPALP